MPYQVLENGIPTDSSHFRYLTSERWKCSTFDTFIEALNYARSWLGPSFRLRSIKLDQAINYNGYGDTIEIRKVD